MTPPVAEQPDAGALVDDRDLTRSRHRSQRRGGCRWPDRRAPRRGYRGRRGVGGQFCSITLAQLGEAGQLLLGELSHRSSRLRCLPIRVAGIRVGSAGWACQGASPRGFGHRVAGSSSAAPPSCSWEPEALSKEVAGRASKVARVRQRGLAWQPPWRQVPSPPTNPVTPEVAEPRSALWAWRQAQLAAARPTGRHFVHRRQSSQTPWPRASRQEWERTRSWEPALRSWA